MATEPIQEAPVMDEQAAPPTPAEKVAQVFENIGASLRERVAAQTGIDTADAEVGAKEAALATARTSRTEAVTSITESNQRVDSALQSGIDLLESLKSGA